jgi:hypothetical protein
VEFDAKEAREQSAELVDQMVSFVPAMGMVATELSVEDYMNRGHKQFPDLGSPRYQLVRSASVPLSLVWPFTMYRVSAWNIVQPLKLRPEEVRARYVRPLGVMSNEQLFGPSFVHVIDLIDALSGLGHYDVLRVCNSEESSGQTKAFLEADRGLRELLLGPSAVLAERLVLNAWERTAHGKCPKRLPRTVRSAIGAAVVKHAIDDQLVRELVDVVLTPSSVS